MKYANLLVVVAVAVILLFSVGNGCSGGKSSPSEGSQQGPPVVGKKIIQWGHDVPNTSLVRQNIRRMEQTGYDGIAIRFYADIPDKDGKIQRSEMDNNWINYRPHEMKHLQRAVENLKATKFERFTDNFLPAIAVLSPRPSECPLAINPDVAVTVD